MAPATPEDRVSLTRRGGVDQAEWRNLIVLCSGTSWDGAWLSDKHLALHLTKYAPVLFVDPPMSVLSPLRKPELRGSLLAPRLSRIAPRLARLTPFAPPGISRAGLRELARLATRAAMRRATRTLGGDVRAVIVGSLDDLFGACGERSRVLFGTDDFAAGGELMNISPSWLRRRERDQLAKADIVTAVSPTLAERWEAMGKKVSVIPNGCDADAYARTDEAPFPSDVDLPAPIAGFIGHMSDRIDLSLLEAVADSGHSLLLIGPRQLTFEIGRMEALLQRPNVQWLGPKPFESLPSYLSAVKVGLTPYADSQFNRASFPLKTLEYLAAGRAAVTSDLPAARQLGTDLVTICGTPQEFAAAVGVALSMPDDPAEVQRRRDFAQQHSWQARTRDFAELLDLT
jgi:teichuronic acid biosynthesis glycosyltransferase TuaH